MILLAYVFALSIALLAIGLAGIASDRHFIVIMLAVELIFVASTISLVAFFSYIPVVNPDAVLMLFSIFAVASVEIITVIALYVFMKQHGIGFDMAYLARMRW